MSIVSRSFNRIMARVDSALGNTDRATDRIVKIAAERLERALDNQVFRNSIGLETTKRTIKFNLIALDYGVNYFGIASGNKQAQNLVEHYVTPIIEKAKKYGIILEANYVKQFPCPEHGAPAMIKARFQPSRT